MTTFYQAEKDCMIFTNLKVMFSILKNHEYLTYRGADREIDKYAFAQLLFRNVGLGPAAQVPVRNPYARIVSFFEDKFHRHPAISREREFEDFEDWQDCQEMFFDPSNIDGSASPETVARQLEAVSFTEMVRFLPTVYRTDPHLRPQVKISTVRWRRLQFRVWFDTITPIEKMDPTFMRNRLGVDVKIQRNSTEHPPYTEYLSTSTLRVLNTLYREDFERLGYERHFSVPDTPTLCPSRSPSDI
jgi:hypothetical protein